MTLSVFSVALSCGSHEVLKGIIVEIGPISPISQFHLWKINRFSITIFIFQHSG